MSSQDNPNLRGSDQGQPDVMRLPQTGISILIVGAGVAGVTAAMECWRKGHQVRIIERAPGVDLSGDFFTIGPSGIKLLRAWPRLTEENERISYNPHVSYHKQTGECVIPSAAPSIGSTGKDTDEKTPSRIYRHHRPNFYQMLLGELKRATGVEVEYNHRVVDYYEDIEAGKGGVVMGDGSKIEADLVIAADGLGTKSHKLVAGHEVKARSSGYAIYRTAYDATIAMADPMVAERWKVPESGQTTAELWAGPDMHMFVWNTGDIMSWLITHKDPGTAAESWHNTVPVSDILQYTSTISDWPEVMNRLIRTTPPSELIDWKLMWRDPQPQWHSPGGRVVQLGDSAHTFLPTSGNGGTQAMEDAITIATCLEIAGSKKGIPMAVTVHNKLRFERVSCCQKLGVKNQNAYHKTDWDAVAKNPDLLKVKYGYWIWSHDSEKYVYENYEKWYVYKPWTVEDMLGAQEAGRGPVDEGDWS